MNWIRALLGIRVPGKYKIGTWVRIASRERFIELADEWERDHKAQEELAKEVERLFNVKIDLKDRRHFAFAGKEARITKFYSHSPGHAIYCLEGIPGVWHESHLEPLPTEDA